MIVEVRAMVEQYVQHVEFYEQCCDDALDAQERGDDYSVEYYRDLQDDEYDSIVKLEEEFRRLGIDWEELI